MAKLHNLKNTKIGIIATDGFEEVELTIPLEEFKKNGAQVDIISEKETIKSWHNRDWGKEMNVDKQIQEVKPDEYDLLLIPGGVINPDRLRRNKEAISLIREFSMKNILIASICHGPQMLIEADLVNGKKLTSFFSIRKDLINAGASWEDSEVVVDGRIITSRNPDDIPAFLEAIDSALGGN